MEFTRLAQLTYHNKYYDAIARITTELDRIQSSTKLPGLWPQRLDASGCTREKQGSLADYINGLVEKPDGGNDAQVAPPVDAESYVTFLDRADENAAQRLDTRSDGDNGDSVKSCTEGIHAPGSRQDVFSMGSRSDSTYECLPKEYILLGGLDDHYRAMYERAMRAAKKYLFFRPMIKDQNRDLRFMAEVTLKQPLHAESHNTRALSYTYDGSHLACYAGGMVAIGAKAFGIDGDMEMAAKLTDGCVWAYEATKTGIMPEEFSLVPCENVESCPWDEVRYRTALDPDPARRIQLAQERKHVLGDKGGGEEEEEEEDEVEGAVSPISPDSQKAKKRGVSSSASHEEYVQKRIDKERLPPGMVQIKSYKYILRPEAIESVFIMYRLTGDNSWRQRGWNMFESIARFTRTELANSAIDNVMVDKPDFNDEMESFWLAETLKYFYLLFSDPSLVSLDEYVL